MIAYLLTCVLIVSTIRATELENISDKPTNYDYYDEILPVVSLTFSKCSCGQLQVYNGSKCISLEEDNIHNITQRITLVSHEPTQIAVIANIREQTCKNHRTVLREGSYVFVNSEVIYHAQSDTIFNASQFCIEYTGSPTENEIIAEVCLEDPTIPVCCSALGCSQAPIVPVNFGDNKVFFQKYNAKESYYPKCTSTQRKEIVNVNQNTSIVYVAGNLSLLWTSPPPVPVPHIISSDSFCLSNEHGVTITFCVEDRILEEKVACHDKNCLRKCCPRDLLYDISTRGCAQASNTSWSPNFSDSKDTEDDLTMLYGYPLCSHHGLYQLDPNTDPGSSFDLFSNGSLYVILTNTMIPFPKYCVDYFQYPDSKLSEKALVCFDPPQEETTDQKCRDIHSILYPILIVISCTFLAITLLVYASVPELYANLHGKSLLSHVTSLLVAYVCQLIVSWNSQGLSMLGCKIIALGTQVSFLWAFFWLNVMCFDIWWTLKSMSPSPESWESSRRRFILYSVYAWGCPLLIGSLTALIEFLPALETRNGLILPGFGLRSCWFQDVKATWLYFHGFTLLLYVLNIFFFFHVAAILILSQRSTEGILRTTRKQYKERVVLYLKLFVVMGITWICEVASWQEGTCEYWIFTDVVNSLQGMFLFFIFMCNKKVFLKVQTKGTPILRGIKALFKTIPQSTPKATSNSSTSQRTTQTSLEASSRRLSTSSLTQGVVQFNVGNKTVESETDLEKISSTGSLNRASL